MAGNRDKDKGLQVNLHAEAVPILYTDNVLITINEDGVVLTVCQMFAQTGETEGCGVMGWRMGKFRVLILDPHQSWRKLPFVGASTRRFCRHSCLRFGI